MNNVNYALRDNSLAELNQSIINWINDVPVSDQEVLDNMGVEMELLIDLLKEGRDIKRLRELYGKLADDLDNENDQDQDSSE
jgi:hypothetical protein